MSADLNKKLFRTFKNDPKYSKKKSEIPIQESDSLDQNETRLINKTKKMAETSELHSGEQNSRNNMYNMVGIVQFNELEEQKDCENVDLILTEQNQNESRKEESTKSKKNKAKCSKNSNSSKYRRKFKSLPREERKKKLDIRESDKQRDVRDWCMSQEVIGVKCIGHDFRKNVDKFDLYLTSSVSVNGSTPMNSTKVKKSKSRKRSEESKKSAIKNSNLVSQKTIEILDDKSENKESEDYKPENMEQEDDKTIRQILDKIVEAKLQKLPSPIQQEPKTTNENENILQNESPLIDNDIDYAQKIEKYTEKENSSKNIASGHMLLENIDEKDMDENITSTVENIQEIERGLLKNDHENEKKDVQTHDLRASPSKSFNELDFEDSLKNSFDENTSPIYSPSEEKSESINGQSNFLKNSPDKNISQIENLKNDTSELINELESASNSLVLQDCQSKDGTENLIFLKNDSEEEESYKENTKEPQSLEEEDDLSKKENASIEDEEKNNSQSSDINESEKKKEEINAQSCDKSVDEKVSTNIADCSINTNESQIIAKTVYKVLEKAKEIVEEEYKLNKLTKKD